MESSGLSLNLVHNPAGAWLPGNQEALAAEYRTHLQREHGVRFNNLFCLSNCPVGRYLSYLLASGNYDDYLRELARAFNPAAARDVMCRTMLSVGWDGALYDCDFNQMLQIPVNHGAPDHIHRFDPNRLHNRRIETRNHCYACTAGSGSSCRGALES